MGVQEENPNIPNDKPENVVIPPVPTDLDKPAEENPTNLEVTNAASESSPAPDNKSEEKPKGSNKLPIIAGIVVLVLILAGVGYFAVSRNNQTEPSPAPTSSPEATDPTADWEKYTGDGYSIKYPSSAEISDTSENNWKGVAIVHLGETQKSSGRTQTSLFDGTAIKTLVITGENQSTKEYAEMSHKVESDGIDSETGSVSSIAETMLDGKTGYYFSVHGQSDVNLYFVDLGNNILRISVIYAGEKDVVPGYIKLADLILSTFKFVN